MKFVDLNELKVRKEYNAAELTIDLGKADDLFDLSFSQFKQLIDGLFADTKQEDVEGNGVIFAVEVAGCETPDDFEYIVDQAVDAIIRNNTTKKRRDREYRLGMPQNLREVHCNQLPLQNAVNYKCKFDVFAIRIDDVEKGWSYVIAD